MLWDEDKHGKIQAQRKNFQKFRSKWKQGVRTVHYLLPGTKYIWYYLLLKAFQRGSIWFQWGLAFILSSSWIKHYGKKEINQFAKVTQPVGDSFQIRPQEHLAPQMLRISHMSNGEFSVFLQFQLDYFKFSIYVYIFRVPNNP